MKETTTRPGCLLQRKILGFFGHDDEGQATTEYALILLAAAVIAVLVITWATAGGGAGRIGDLFDSVFDGVLDKTTQTTLAP
jgi:Flp pilus assembly pilin Flp